MDHLTRAGRDLQTHLLVECLAQEQVEGALFGFGITMISELGLWRELTSVMMKMAES
ncbi:MAG: hypothetical protein IPH63_08405 [Flavobacteriales bacterium]|nr:hypothetical protein [Flavobacteriales bacterium]